MADLQLTLNAEERDFLAELLKGSLKEKRVEEHRTRSISYRENVLQEENLITAILGKLGHRAPFKLTTHGFSLTWTAIRTMRL